MARSRLKPDRVRGWLVAPLLAHRRRRAARPGLGGRRVLLARLLSLAAERGDGAQQSGADCRARSADRAARCSCWSTGRCSSRGWRGASAGPRRSGRASAGRCAAVAVVVLAFMIMWGFHYRRLPLEATLAHVAHAVSRDAAAGHRRRQRARGQSPSEDAGRPRTSPTRRWPRSPEGPMDRALVALNRTPLARPGRPKFSLILTPFFTWSGVDGMIDPLALESIVHPDLLPVERPFVLAHEWAHLAGQADEAEASAVGWLACMKGGPDDGLQRQSVPDPRGRRRTPAEPPAQGVQPARTGRARRSGSASRCGWRGRSPTCSAPPSASTTRTCGRTGSRMAPPATVARSR